jgi:hypothetical protein
MSSLSTQLNGPRWCRSYHFVLVTAFAAVTWWCQCAFSLIPVPASTAGKKESPNRSSANFAHFPHNKLGYGNEAFCDWKSLSMNDSIASSLIGSQAPSPDQIQKAALRESICIPRNETLLSKLHLFSTEQARACLSEVTLLVTGDSYNYQLLIGLAEIIIGVASNDEIVGWYKRQHVRDEILKVSCDKVSSRCCPAI